MSSFARLALVLGLLLALGIAVTALVPSSQHACERATLERTGETEHVDRQGNPVTVTHYQLALGTPAEWSIPTFRDTVLVAICPASE